jgi:hypothetical protein
LFETELFPRSENGITISPGSLGKPSCRVWWEIAVRGRVEREMIGYRLLSLSSRELRL